MYTLDHIRSSLGASRPYRVAADGRQRAAVAAVLRSNAKGPELLLIRRADQPEKHWAGHVGFPGGHAQTGDASLLATAIRETRAEIGVDLESEAGLIAELPHVVAPARDSPERLVIAPFLFELLADPAFVLDGDVREMIWAPLGFLVEESNRSRFRWSRGGISIFMPCCRFEGWVVWGLTLRMIDELIAACATRPTEPES